MLQPQAMTGKIEKVSKAILGFLASLKLAVITIIFIGIVCAWGTIVESQYNSEIAYKVVYKSVWMYLALGMLVVNLLGVMVDRLPWKKKHIPFILAHTGIIILLLGAYITQERGLDGSIAMDIGETNSYVTVPNTDLNVYQLTELQEYKRIHSEEVDFYLRSPQKKEYKINTPDGPIVVTDYIPFAIRKVNVSASKRIMDGPALRYQLKNNFVSENDWLVQQGQKPEVRDFGPTKLVLAKEKFEPKDKGNQVVFWPTGRDAVSYAIYYKDGRPKKTGTAKKGDTIPTGWMGNLEIIILGFYKNASYQTEYERHDRPNDLTTAAIEVSFNGQKQWAGLNSALELFTSKAGYILTYSNRRIPLGFEVKLLDFSVGKYQGTNNPMSYQSQVEIPSGKHMISMNEPLKYNGLTLYQASFQQDTTGKPTTSILSVNKDPGRPLKYIGSILIVLGSASLFYNRKLRKVQG